MKHKRNQESTTEIKRRSTTIRNVIIASTILFIALIIGSAGNTDQAGQTNTRSLIWAVASSIGVLTLLGSMVVSYLQADERQQLIELKASSLAFLVVLVSLFAAEMLHAILTVNLGIAVQTIFITGTIVWATTRLVLERNNRP